MQKSLSQTDYTQNYIDRYCRGNENLFPSNEGQKVSFKHTLETREGNIEHYCLQEVVMNRIKW